MSEREITFVTKIPSRLLTKKNIKFNFFDLIKNFCLRDYLNKSSKISFINNIILKLHFVILINIIEKNKLQQFNKIK